MAWTGPDTMLPAGAQSAVAVAISDDGLTVAGQATMSDGTRRAFVWVHGSSAIYIPLLAGFTEAVAYDITADGSAVFGTCLGASPDVAFKWTSGGGTVDFTSGALAQALCCSADGAVIYGSRYDPDTDLPQGARWTAGGGVVPVGGDFEVGTLHIVLGCASPDGATVWGTYVAAGPVHLGSWNAGTGLVDHGSPGSDILGLRSTSVSADGSRVVVSTTGPDSRGWLWTAPGTFTALSDVGLASDAYGITADGTMVAGDFTSGDSEWAGVWTAAGGWVQLPLVEGGGGLVSGITPDGGAVFGASFDAGGVQSAAVWRQGDAGLGTLLDDTPSQNLVWLSWSDDGGHSFGNPVSQSLGRTGQYNASLQWQRLGMGRRRVFKVEWSAPVATVLLGAWVDVSSGQS